MALKLNITKVSDETQFKSLVMEGSDSRLFVVDVYSGWCGPCKAILPTFKSICLELENYEDRVCFVQADASLVPQLASFGGTSEPNFILYKDGAIVAQISGANAPLLQQKIFDLVPPL